MFVNSVRLAAFRLVEAGMEAKPGIESQVLLSMHCKVLVETRTDRELFRSSPCATASK